MFVPFLTTRSSKRSSLPKRAGGGGGGSGSSSSGGGSRGGSGGGGGGSSSSPKSGSSGSSSGSGSSASPKSGGSGSSGTGSSSPKSGGTGTSSSGSSERDSGSGSSSSSSSSSSGSRSYPVSSSYGYGNGYRYSAGTRNTGTTKVTTIASGQLFAGRTIGGGTRSQVYGTRAYGSGYPGVSGLGVGGRGFPFYFWPIVYGNASGANEAAYLNNTEYGTPSNTSRPGGSQEDAAFKSNSTGTIYRILSDNSTVASLIEDINANCSRYLTSDSAKSPSTFDEGKPEVRPEQVVQYYRASSVALSLDGYNNSAVYGNSQVPPSDLPSGIDTNLLSCLNDTIGTNVPLVSGASSIAALPNVGLLGLLYIFWTLSSLVF